MLLPTHLPTTHLPSSPSPLLVPPPQAARTIQRWFRGWRLHRHAPLLRQLVGVAGELRAAAARFYEHMGATASHITHKQYLEVNELAMRVIFKLDRWVVVVGFGFGVWGTVWYGQRIEGYTELAVRVTFRLDGGRGVRVEERDVEGSTVGNGAGRC